MKAALWAVGLILLCAQTALDAQAASPDPIIGDWQETQGRFVAQVFANGEHKYEANVLKQFDAPGSLLAVLHGVRTGPTVRFEGDNWIGVIEKERFQLQTGDERRVLEKVVRRSPTLGAKPPPGAIVLFDSTSLKEWTKQKPKEWDQSGGPVDGWKLVEDGVVEAVPGTGSIITRKSFGDCVLHVEFRTLGPVNSGVYLQARYEISINESYGRRDGSLCGALGNAVLDGTPKINASRPPFQWQTLDVVFLAPRFDNAGKKTENARLTIRLNGITLVERTEIPSVRGAAKRLGEASAGPLMLQEHGAPIQFRNLWLVEKAG